MNWIAAALLVVVSLAFGYALGMYGLWTLDHRNAASPQGGAASGSYSSWLGLSGRVAMKNSMYPAMTRLRACIDKRDRACACAANLPDLSNLQSESQDRWNGAPDATRARYELFQNVLAEYDNLRRVQKSACASGSLEEIDAALVHCGQIYNQLVDELNVPD